MLEKNDEKNISKNTKIIQVNAIMLFKQKMKNSIRVSLTPRLIDSRIKRLIRC